MAGQRPGGVVLIAVLAWIGAIAQIISGILVLTRVLSPQGVGTESAWIAIVVGVISFIVAFFLFSGSNIARILVTISFVLSLLTAIFALLANPANFVAPILSGLVALIGIALLYTGRANEFFRH
ncbi:hypothetical protein [Microbacterium sp.]|uniref:hypothetical protein n=1 Tax=Microbacterium sp. TaxID=51671 RepID=UPI00092BAA4F|nr:hypothetical protein [Microbacterium sp.]MBN9194096.1 hypothetical protein [Microbacterium sp.]OJU59900.1 MAG: hypothetical protein BGO04_03610 [Microbacterium sp. 70-38]